MSHMLNLADNSYLLRDEAYRLPLSLLCSRLSTPSYDCNPNVRHCFAILFIKKCCCWEKMCLSCPMPSVGRYELVLYHISSNICDFQPPVYNVRHFFAKLFIKTCCCWQNMCLSCQMPSVDRLELMFYHFLSLAE